jgi:hypothetical protein
MARAATAAARIAAAAAAGAAAVGIGNITAGAADTAVIVDPDPDPDTAKFRTEAQPGRQVERAATAATADTSTPANGAEEATVVLTEEAAAVVSAATPEGADTASTKSPTVPSTILILRCFYLNPVCKPLTDLKFAQLYSRISYCTVHSRLKKP